MDVPRRRHGGSRRAAASEPSARRSRDTGPAGVYRHGVASSLPLCTVSRNTFHRKVVVFSIRVCLCLYSVAIRHILHQKSEIVSLDAGLACIFMFRMLLALQEGVLE